MMRVFVRPRWSATMPKKIPPMAQPMRKMEKMMPPYQPICSVRDGLAGGLEQIVQRRVEDDRVDRRVHRIEDPAKPGDKQDEPLIARDALSPRLSAHEGLSHRGDRSA